MPRVSRTFFDHACYHVHVRGNQKQAVFLHDEDREKYLKLLKKLKCKHSILLYTYCLMENHVHLLIEVPKARNLSKFMHGLNRGYTAYFNDKYGKAGHLWQGRFRSHPILKGQYLINVATYIENNPVRSSLVSEASMYPWSSYRERCLMENKHMLDSIKIDLSYEDT